MDEQKQLIVRSFLALSYRLRLLDKGQATRMERAATYEELKTAYELLPPFLRENAWAITTVTRAV